MSHHSIPEEEAYENIHGKIELNIKNQFIKKVYSILAVQLLATAAICSAFMLWTPLREASIAFVKYHPWIYNFTMFSSMIVSICALMVKKNEYPANYQLMGVFVVLVSCNVGILCAVFYAAGKGMAIAQAVLVTAVIFLTLTAYAHLTKQDFSFLNGFMISALTCLILFGFIAMLTGSTLLIYVYHILGVLVFCAFILIDSSALIHKYGCDDYIIASIELYLDIINLFLHILAILGKR